MSDDALKSLDEKLKKAGMYGQWTADLYLQQVTDGPKPAGVPNVWRWDEVSALLDEACTAMPESLTARRSLMFVNPGLQRGSTHTLAMGVQMILPGETAWSHRHSISALRFTIMGSKRLYSVVDGEPCMMEPHDLVLTPGWTWHDHHNESDDRCAWLDVLDVPLMIALNQAFYEPYGEERQPLRNDGEAQAARYGAFPPAWESVPGRRVPVRYAWADMEARLRAVAATGDGSPWDGVALEYTNPITGGPTLPTLTCWASWIKPGQKLQSHRRTSSAVYHVVRGQGRARVGDTELSFGPRDSFCVPNWAWHHIENASERDELVLFSVHDIPVLRALGLYREEPTGQVGCMPPARIPGDLARPGGPSKWDRPE
jgi:1-hydroxy-2-naphthoate dioxygenase